MSCKTSAAINEAWFPAQTVTLILTEKCSSETTTPPCTHLSGGPLDASVDLPQQAWSRAGNVFSHLVLPRHRITHHGRLDLPKERHLEQLLIFSSKNFGKRIIRTSREPKQENIKKKTMFTSPLVGLEPTIPGLENQCLIH